MVAVCWLVLGGSWLCLRRTLIKSPIWQLVPCPHCRSHSCERLLPGRKDKMRQETRLFLGCFQMVESRVRAWWVQERAKGAKGRKPKRGKGQWWNRGWDKKQCIHTLESFLIDSLDSYHPGRIHSFNKMCHTDVVTGGSAGRMDGRSTKRSFQSRSSPQHSHSHPGMCWLSSLFHHKERRFIWRENWTHSLSTIITGTPAWVESG